MNMLKRLHNVRGDEDMLLARVGLRILAIAALLVVLLAVAIFPFSVHAHNLPPPSAASPDALTNKPPSTIAFRRQINRRLFAYIIRTQSRCKAKNVAALISKGANPNAKTEAGDGVTLLNMPVLVIAIMAEANSCAIKLVQLGAIAGISKESVADTAFQEDALWAAISQHQLCDPKLVKLLLEHGSDPNELTKGGYRVLEGAVLSSNVDCARVLIQAGAKVSGKGTKGYTALSWAGAASTPEEAEELVRMLLKHGANPNSDSFYGTTPVFSAVVETPGFRPNTQALKLLLHAGADPNVTDEKGLTPLLLALRPPNSPSLDLINTLVKGGADVNLANSKTGETPLMAAAKGNEKIVRYLLKHGAQLGRRDMDGKSAIDYARTNHCNQIVKLLIRWKASAGNQGQSQINERNLVTLL